MLNAKKKDVRKKFPCSDSFSPAEYEYESYFFSSFPNFPIITFQYSFSFSPAEYESESYFFPSRLDFTENYDKDLKMNKIGCF